MQAAPCSSCKQHIHERAWTSFFPVLTSHVLPCTGAGAVVWVPSSLQRQWTAATLQLLATHNEVHPPCLLTFDFSLLICGTGNPPPSGGSHAEMDARRIQICCSCKSILWEQLVMVCAESVVSLHHIMHHHHQLWTNMWIENAVRTRILPLMTGKKCQPVLSIRSTLIWFRNKTIAVSWLLNTAHLAVSQTNWFTWFVRLPLETLRPERRSSKSMAVLLKSMLDNAFNSDMVWFSSSSNSLHQSFSPLGDPLAWWRIPSEPWGCKFACQGQEFWGPLN